MADLDTRAVGAGIPIGAGIGATIAALADGNLALGAGYGAATGIVVGTILARMASSFYDSTGPWIALGVGTLLPGAVVGGTVGAVAAWGNDVPLVDGVLAGVAGGLTVAVLVGVVVWIEVSSV